MVVMSSISSLGDYHVEFDNLYLSFAVGREGKQASSNPEALESAIAIYTIVTKDLSATDERTLKTSLMKLANLCFTQDRDSSRSNRQMVLQAGGHRKIINAMQLFPKNRFIQLNGMRCLNNFSYDAAEAKFMIVSTGGIEQTVYAMQIHSENYSLQLLGCNTLTCLLAGDKENALRIQQAGGISAVTAALKANRDKEELYLEAFELLRNMCPLHPSIKSELEKPVHMFSIVSAMENEDFKPSTCDDARLLVNLVMDY